MTTKETTVTDLPKIRVGKLDGVWAAAVRDQLGWVQLGTGEDVDERVDGWTPVEPVKRPRVFFNGDTIPAGVKVMDQNGDVIPGSFDDDGEEWDNGNLGPLVEVTVDYAAEVARARAARGEA